MIDIILNIYIFNNLNLNIYICNNLNVLKLIEWCFVERNCMCIYKYVKKKFLQISVSVIIILK